MRIPYGQSNFASLRADRQFYADKTSFIPQLESLAAGYKYTLFLRPRRMGKSLLVSMLAHYYDLARRQQFDDLFGGLWIHEHPTEERNRYVVLTLDFSTVDAGAGQDMLQQSFLDVVKGAVEELVIRYRDLVPELGRIDARLDSYRGPEAIMVSLTRILGATGHKLYLFVDEYDNFANRLLAGGELELYESIVRGTGFVRSFYAALKAGTASGGLGRMFITGVSPILLDDLSSGFNILTHISLQARFNSMVGFTRAEVERAVDEFLADRPELREDPRLGNRAELLSTLERHYNGYLFSKYAEERVYNSDLVLYFLREIENHGRYPEQMLDLNVRTDYSRLQRLAALSGAAGRELRALLETTLTEEKITSPIVEQFGSRSMHSPRQQLLSLLYYSGVLTFGTPSPDRADPDLVIPNRLLHDTVALFVQGSERSGQSSGRRPRPPARTGRGAKAPARRGARGPATDGKAAAPGRKVRTARRA